MRDTLRQAGADRAADAKSHEEHGKNEREGVRRRAEKQRQEPSPDHLGTQCRHSRQRNRDVHEADAGLASGGLDGGRRVMFHDPRDGKRDDRDNHVQPDRHHRRGGHVIHAKQVKTREQASGDGSGEIAAVEVPEPRYAVRRRFDTARDHRKRGPHQQRRRQQADARDERPEHEARRSCAGPFGIETSDDGNAIQDHHAEKTDAQLEERIDAQRVMPCADISWQQQTAQTHAAHVDPQQHSERYGRGAD